MIYTEEEKTKIDALLTAFQSYIDQQEDYEVLYSQKAGYLRVMVGESCDNIYFPIESFAYLVERFTEEILQEKTEGYVDRHTEEAYRYVRSQMAPILDTLGIYRDEAYEAMEETINEDCRQNFHCQERLEWKIGRAHV